MKFFVSGLYQETNSFCPVATDLDLFRREKLIEGVDLLQDIRGTNLELAGMVEEIERRFAGASIATGIHAWGVACGPLTPETFEGLSERTLARLQAALPVDGVLLALHGSMGSATTDDCEGELLSRVRRVVGEGIPIGVSLDFHAVVTSAMLRTADVLTGYRTYPHVDQAATGRRAVVALASLLKRGRAWKPVARRWPAIIPVDNAQTDLGPVTELADAVGALERLPGVLTASMFCSHPWFDTPDQGATLLAYADETGAELAEGTIEAALRRFWERRRELIVECPGPADFFQAASESRRPIAAIDAGDVTTAGGVGDSTEMLRAAIREKRLHTLIPIVAADAVERARLLGERTTEEFTVGVSDNPNAYNRRTPVTATVARLPTGPIRMSGPAFGGISIDPGPRALLQAGPVHLLAMQHASWFHDPELWRNAGIDPGAADVVVQKSHKLFRPAYARLIRSVTTVETGGCTDRRLDRLPFCRIQRPIFPLDEMPGFLCRPL